MSDDPFPHAPVMLDEVLEVLRPMPAGVFVDATLGGGGHAAAVLAARPDVELVGFDQDADALAAATTRLASDRERVRTCHARFDHLGAELDRLGVEAISGVLFDLGVSSPQLDRAERGFSFRREGPLDMRMNPAATGETAATIVNEASIERLAEILRTYGDERHAHRLARAIVAARPIHTTVQLAAVVSEAMPAASRRSPGHPARRTFQAIRIAVNQELDVIEPALEQAIGRLLPHGRGAVLTYHSGEDRVVKHALRRAAGLDRHQPRGLPVDPPPAAITLLRRGGRTATAAEIEANPRASSARLRAFVRTEVAA